MPEQEHVLRVSKNANEVIDAICSNINWFVEEYGYSINIIYNGKLCNLGGLAVEPGAEIADMSFIDISQGDDPNAEPEITSLDEQELTNILVQVMQQVDLYDLFKEQ